jgi:uncharacterized protein
VEDDIQYTIKIHTSMQNFDAESWDALTDGTPLLSHAFLSALESSNSIGKSTGWIPYPMAVYNMNEVLVGAMPLYLKTHSYGEYVFDWAWADAFERNQLAYYPKLVSAIPFSPITSKRLLGSDESISKVMIKTLSDLLNKHHLSSAHILFPDHSCSTLLDSAQWLKRHGVQFRWHNQQYSHMDDFLATLSHDKRKKIKQERKKVSDANVNCRWILGSEISESDWNFFYQCYCNTYYEHHSTPYLTRAFFREIGQTMPQNIVLIFAEVEGNPIAAALNFYNKETLYGRYWGTTQFVSGLHFELCYYQAQEFCIANQIRYFEGGAQGEHKLARGFEPRPTCSYHLIANTEFAKVIQEFLYQESQGIAAYTNELEERAPFKK